MTPRIDLARIEQAGYAHPNEVAALVAVVEAARAHISECDNPVPDLVMKASTRFRLRDTLHPFTEST
jgi:hypothetical protein